MSVTNQKKKNNGIFQHGCAKVVLITFKTKHVRYALRPKPKILTQPSLALVPSVEQIFSSSE